jgi:hypothetical protein
MTLIHDDTGLLFALPPEGDWSATLGGMNLQFTKKLNAARQAREQIAHNSKFSNAGRVEAQRELGEVLRRDFLDILRPVAEDLLARRDSFDAQLNRRILLEDLFPNTPLLTISIFEQVQLSRRIDRLQDHLESEPAPTALARIEAAAHAGDVLLPYAAEGLVGAAMDSLIGTGYSPTTVRRHLWSSRSPQVVRRLGAVRSALSCAIGNHGLARTQGAQALGLSTLGEDDAATAEFLDRAARAGLEQE